MITTRAATTKTLRILAIARAFARVFALALLPAFAMVLAVLPSDMRLLPVARAADRWPDLLTTGKPWNIGLSYAAPTPERLDAFVKLGCKTILGGAVFSVAGWGTPRAASLDPYRALGLNVLVYSTPHSIFGDGYFSQRDPMETVPRSRSWLALDGDGQPLRPWGTERQRYAACVNNPGWRAHSREAVSHLARIGALGVFWDDAIPLGCDCPICQDAFRAWLAARYTDAELDSMRVTETGLPPPPATRLVDMRDCKTQVDREWVLFAEASLEDFLKEMKGAALAVDPGFVFSANCGQPDMPALVVLSQAVMDLWIFEEGPHSLAPQANNSLRYLQGFARAMRKPVEMIPGGEGWGQEGATPEQYAASLDEAVACGGEMVIHFGSPGKEDEAWRIDPETGAVIARIRSFFDERQGLLAGLRPAARIAILDSNKSYLYDRTYQPRLEKLAKLLIDSGIPFTVLNVECSSGQLERFDAVLVGFASVLSDAEVASLLEYAGRGGLLIRCGPCGTIDERWRPRETPLAPTFEAEPSQTQLLSLLGDMERKAPRLLTPPGADVQLHAWLKDGGAGREGDGAGSLWILHLVNYSLEAPLAGGEGESKPPRSKSVAGLRLDLPESVAVQSVQWETPEGESRRLDAAKGPTGWTVALPQLGAYALVTVRTG
ncbi:MAG: hypothetical protein ACE15D_02935 [Candidatus Eisenbacteria bacterium]|nr:hypothetical protein [Candidatus Eisenbacteria bacterium]